LVCQAREATGDGTVAEGEEDRGRRFEIDDRGTD
jgi:hypothetical protein